MTDAPIVVGLNHSPAAAHALRWAAAECVRTSTPLVAAHVYQSYDPGPVPVHLATVEESWARARATRWLQQADVDMTGPWPSRLVVVPGDVVDGLVELSRDAGMLVLGHDASPEADGAGWVVERCQRLARCPVVVLPHPTPQPTSAAASPTRTGVT